MPRTGRRTEENVPSYRANGAYARVTIDGETHSLGRINSPESRELYRRLIGEWAARKIARKSMAVAGDAYSMRRLMADYLAFAVTEYVKAGRPTREYEHIRTILAQVETSYASLTADQFDPLALQAVRAAMLSRGLTTIYINQQIARLVRMFRWGVAQGRVRPDTWQSLMALKGLRTGRAGKRSRKVLPAPEWLIDGAKGLCAPQVAALIDLQLLTGARPGEIIAVRTCDVDRSSRIWQIKPQEHKTERFGIDRLILLGPRAQEIIAPWFRLNLQEYLFRPDEAMEHHLFTRAANRKTPANAGNCRGSRPRGANRLPKGNYTVCSYRRAIIRACERAFPPDYPVGRRPAERDELGKLIRRRETAAEWRERLNADPDLMAAYRAWHQDHRFHPHQLRHNAATRLAAEFGIKLAKTILGHTNAATTLRYAEMEGEIEAAREAIGRVG